jgi:orotate phosphoribosyltransferase
MWLELDQLFRRPSALGPFVAELAQRIAVHRIDVVCGPLTGGALLAALMAADLGVDFALAAPAPTDRPGLYPVDYRIAPALRDQLRGRRVAVVDDAISAGSAVRGTLSDLDRCGATPVALGALFVMGPMGPVLAADRRLPLERLAELPYATWPPVGCPHCAAGVPLLDP